VGEFKVVADVCKGDRVRLDDGRVVDVLGYAHVAEVGPPYMMVRDEAGKELGVQTFHSDVFEVVTP
jgi:hypothetical protein